MSIYRTLISDESLEPPGPMLRPVASLVAVGAWAAAVIALLIGFHHFNWGYGLQRFFLLFGLGCTCLFFTWALGWMSLALPSWRWLTLGLTLVILYFGATYLQSSLGSIRQHWDGSNPDSDQAQNCYRAIRLLEVGVNPYGADVFLDPDEWHINGPWMVSLGECLPDWDYEAADARMKEFWATLDLDLMAKIVPVFPDTEECREWARRFHSLGCKYGPILLLGYWPFVAGFGQVGILVNHLVLFIAAVTALALWMRSRTRNPLHVLIPLLVVFAGSHIRGGVLRDGHSDLLPVVLAGVFLVLWIEKKHRWAALVLGCCVASKTFPGMIYAPLLLRRPRDIPLFLVPLAVVYLPFLAWDAKGLWNNLSYPLLYVRYDSGSVGFDYQPESRRVISLACIATALGFLSLAFLSRWNTRTVLLYLVVTHLAVMCAGRMFHNNYLTWLAVPIPFLIFWCVKKADETWRTPAEGHARPWSSAH